MKGFHERKTNILELVYFDVCGPINVKSSGGASYFVTFIDDASKKVWAYPMKKKGEVFEIFQNFHVVIGRKTNKLLKCLRRDNGGEYCSNAFKDYCNRFGIKHQKIVPGTPQQNGTIERYYHGEGEEYVVQLRIGKAFLGRSSKDNLLPYKLITYYNLGWWYS